MSDLDRIASGDLEPGELQSILTGQEFDRVLAETGLTAQALREAALERLTAADVADATRLVCSQDFPAFLTYEMGMDVVPHVLEWWELLRTGEDVCIMAPRDHGKSLTCARAYAIWKAKYDPFVREVYVLGADQESAVENLDKIKELLVTRRSLRDLVPNNWKQGFNNRTSLRTTNGKTIRAKSFFSKLRGRHPQLIVLDDVLNESNSDSEQKRKKISNQFGSVIVPMKDKAPKAAARGFRSQIVTIGTAMAADDLYHEQLESPAYKGMRQSAILVDGNFDPILDAQGQRQSLWPERYSIADLDKLKDKIGSLLFEREYMNKPIVDDMAIFPRSLFQPLFDEELSYVPSYTGDRMAFMGADFSVPGNQDGDWTVIFAVEYDRDARRWTPLNFWRARPSTVREQLEQVEYFAQAYRVSKGYLEDNVFQRVYAQAVGQRTNLPLEGFTTGRQKNSYVEGLLALRPQLEVGQWRFPYRTKRDRDMTDLLVREFSGIVQRKGKLGNESSHDDVPMAAWLAWRAAMDVTAGAGWQADWGW